MQLVPRQQEIQEVARDLARRYLAPDAAGLDQDEAFPTDNLKRLGQAGLLGVNIEPSFGGLGGGVVSYVLAVRELAQSCAATTVAMMVTNMVAEAIQRFGDDEQRERYLPPLRQGQWPAYAFSLSEPGAGSDAASLKTTAVRRADDYILDGVKSWVTSGGHSGVYLVMAATDPSQRSRGISAFLVDPETPGFTVTRPEEKLGLRGSATTQLVFDQAAVSSGSRLGEEGIGFKIAMSSLDGGRVGVSAQACGIASAALDCAARFVQENPDKQTEAEAIRLLADSKVELDAAWLLCLRAATLKDQGRPLTREAAASKLYCTEMANRVCDRMLQIVGSQGCDQSMILERLARDVRVTRIYEGTSEVQRIVIAREVLKAAGRGNRS